MKKFGNFTLPFKIDWGYPGQGRAITDAKGEPVIFGMGGQNRLSVERDVATLFAAAPDLLEACKHVLETSFSDDTGYYAVLRVVEDAVKKAETQS